MDNLIPIVLFFCVAGVMILRPITKPLGRYLDAMARDLKGRKDPERSPEAVDVERVTALFDRLNTRLDLLEDRMQFVERLSDERPRTRLASLD